ncbi:MAG: lycopene cyclase domain-containing protein [Halobacteria archaeon]|nr:lycopene cyclase domain-containing protein [Halobacteria archaeon]
MSFSEPPSLSISYLEFHLIFVIPVVVALMYLWKRREGFDGFGVAGLGIMVALALVYTTPWDSYLIRKGVWGYGEGVVTTRLWKVPLGEYIFMALLPLVGGTWSYVVDAEPDVSFPLPYSPPAHLVGAVAGASVGLIGYLLLSNPSTYYLGAILGWAAPVLALQWGFGGAYLARRLRTVVYAIGVPTAYLCVVDWAAISMGLWQISPEHTVGLSVAGLPVEEITFFLVTNTFVVQGLVLWRWVVAKWGRDAGQTTEG